MEAESTLQHIEGEALIIVKAAPRASRTHGETVCIAALDRGGNWIRLYPVSFRYLADAQKFGRWDWVKYRWRRPRAMSDPRPESRRVDPDSIELVGSMRATERNPFIHRVAVKSLKAERQAGRSLALLRAEVLDFACEPRPKAELVEQKRVYDELRSQQDMFAASALVPREPCPYSFKYRYRDDDGEHEGTCQDWETEATFFRRRAELGEAKALGWMKEKFGQEYPQKGMALAMGTHRYRSEQWLINGVIRLNEEGQLSLI